MGKNYDYVSDVNARKFCWNFKVDVIRIWEHPTKFNEKKVGSIEMILQDSKGGRGHASIPKSIIKKWSDAYYDKFYSGGQEDHKKNPQHIAGY
ncbi:hypothetical protein Ahy_A01g003424 [Arachis hypogaea]|uniref:Replication protein A 70 kDa DNA-binding subunit B/D first OB fold domain-containing protein n=1 Tax=Arachis hypogaea TaxID=3818 RepID=A0A445ETD4_ARAHY|nr:hypothetical protein Ahy_A01g003424 [Arachis hypogaea]